MISIRFQGHGPLNREGFARAGESALILTGSKEEQDFAHRIVDALEELYVEGAGAGLWEELEIRTGG